MLEHSDRVFVKKVKGKGRGVFARRPIRKGDVIEKVPVILVPLSHIANGLKNPSMGRFCFVRNDTTLAIALGYGSLYNHSYTPNARYDDDPAMCMSFTAIRDIQEGEEITINYNGQPNDRRPMGFEVV